MAPGQNGGSQILYHRLIRPFVLKHHPKIDKHIQNGIKKNNFSHFKIHFSVFSSYL